MKTRQKSFNRTIKRYRSEKKTEKKKESCLLAHSFSPFLFYFSWSNIEGPSWIYLGKIKSSKASIIFKINKIKGFLLKVLLTVASVTEFHYVLGFSTSISSTVIGNALKFLS